MAEEQEQQQLFVGAAAGLAAFGITTKGKIVLIGTPLAAPSGTYNTFGPLQYKVEDDSAADDEAAAAGTSAGVKNSCKNVPKQSPAKNPAKKHQKQKPAKEHQKQKPAKKPKNPGKKGQKQKPAKKPKNPVGKKVEEPAKKVEDSEVAGATILRRPRWWFALVGVAIACGILRLL